MVCGRVPAVPPQGKVVFKEEWLYIDMNDSVQATSLKM